MATVPLRYSNRLGFPMLQVQSIADATLPSTVTYFKFNEHPQRNVSFYGGFFVKVPSTENATDTNTVSFMTEDDTTTAVPLYNYNGDPATVTDVATTGGVLLCFYDKTNNRLQLINAF